MQTVTRNCRTPCFAAPPVFISTFCLALATCSHLFFFFLPYLARPCPHVHFTNRFFFSVFAVRPFFQNTDTFLGHYNRRLWKLLQAWGLFFRADGKCIFFRFCSMTTSVRALPGVYSRSQRQTDDRWSKNKNCVVLAAGLSTSGASCQLIRLIIRTSQPVVVVFLVLHHFILFFRPLIECPIKLGFTIIIIHFIYRAIFEVLKDTLQK